MQSIADHLWEISFSRFFQESKKNYLQSLGKKALSCSLQEKDAERYFELAERETFVFDKFINALKHFQNDCADPKALPEARYKDTFIANYYYLEVRPWRCYFYRDYAGRRGVGVLLLHRRDRPQNLIDALKHALQVWIDEK